MSMKRDALALECRHQLNIRDSDDVPEVDEAIARARNSGHYSIAHIVEYVQRYLLMSNLTNIMIRK